MPEQNPLNTSLDALLEQALAEAMGGVSPPACGDPATRADLEMIRSALAVAREDAHLDVHADAIRAARTLLPSARESLVNRVLRGVDLVVARLLDDRPLLDVGFRGPAAPAQFAYRAEDVEIHIRVAPPSDADRLWLILGQVDESARGAARSASLSLIGRSDVCAEAVVGPDGVFTLESTEGVFDLLVKFDQSTVLVPSIEVG